MQEIDGLTQFCDGSRVQKHVVRSGQSLGAAGLGAQNCARLLFRAAITRLQPLYLQHLVRIDNQYAIDEIGRAHV